MAPPEVHNARLSNQSSWLQSHRSQPTRNQRTLRVNPPPTGNIEVNYREDVGRIIQRSD
ncbi:unnamed protein product [Timema podura]|uniref:Uncharacterized protein n=1 Tax=Timema podura TaxID=61482 RepID=A0ABN7PTL7_TIMPD|nr:unnamed protein product [Timema podura]